MKTIYKTLLSGFILCFFGQAFAAYTLPEYQKTTLDNGLTVYLMEQKEVPLIDATVVFNAGATRDGELAGLATMTTENMLFGARKLNKNAFEEALEFVGAEFDTDVSLDDSRISASFAKKDQQQILGLLADVVKAPSFDATEFDKYKTRYLGALKRQKESPRNVIASYNNQLIYGEHPYSNPVGGDAVSTEKATLDDLKSFYQGWFRPENAALVIVGDFDAKAMLANIDGLFADWKGAGKAAKKTAFPVVEGFDKDRVLLVNKDDARETTFYIGGLGIPRSNVDFVALSVINTVLGGRFTSWLNDELRVNSGLTYGARSRFSAMKHSGHFYISTFTATENTEAAIDLALSTYARLWEKGLDDATLKSAKAYVKGLFPPRYETSGQLSGLLGDMFIYGFDESFINNFQSNVDKLDSESSKALIAKYFPQDNLQFTIIGKSSEIKDIVKKYGDVTEVDITAPGFSF
ncbi:M16 family metallopeptidase [Planctobacterium marinum]|uniref:Peptidase M16 n=1 Tax=Planctobacterium marinum TaxID=1631968 RepID=A0AA48HMD8_9ALTE|nr:peptidase M16 [Planctobacterium marinum]